MKTTISFFSVFILLNSLFTVSVTALQKVPIPVKGALADNMDSKHTQGAGQNTFNKNRADVAYQRRDKILFFKRESRPDCRRFLS